MSENVTDLTQHKDRKRAEAVSDLLAPDGYMYGEQGLAERFVDQNKGRFIYNHTRNIWMRRRGAVYLEDEKDTVRRMFRPIALELLELSLDAPGGHRDRLQNQGNAANRSNTQANALRIARTDSRIAVVEAELNRDPWRIPAKNGVIDLRTGELEGPRPDELWSKQVEADYDPRATAPTFERFLSDTFSGDVETMEYVRRISGYSLTASTREQKFWVCVGQGANGKTVFYKTLMRLMGGFAQQAPNTAVLAKRSDGVPTDLARMAGARLVIASETNRGRSLDEALVKALTGGDTIAARFMNQDFFEFEPVLKLILSSNHRPVIKGTDHGMWRRVRLIEFPNVVPPDRQDPDLLDKITAELPGVLAWAVAGAVDWYRNGLQEPKSVLEATQQYRDEQDQVGAFLRECCFVNTEGPEDERPFETSANLITAMGDYLNRKVSPRTLQDELPSRDLVPGRRRVGNKVARGWIGLELQPELKP